MKLISNGKVDTRFVPGIHKYSPHKLQGSSVNIFGLCQCANGAELMRSQKDDQVTRKLTSPNSTFSVLSIKVKAIDYWCQYCLIFRDWIYSKPGIWQRKTSTGILKQSNFDLML